MSSAEKDREVYQDEEDNSWYYQVQNEYGWFPFGPYQRERDAIEAMQLHGLEE